MTQRLDLLTLQTRLRGPLGDWAQGRLWTSVPRFPLVPECKYIDGVVGTVMPVERHIPGIPKVDHELAENWDVVDRATDIGTGLQ